MPLASNFPESLPLGQIESVTFYKRDEITTDLICCDVQVSGTIWFFHEEMDSWAALIQHLEHLPGFRADWRAAVVQPPFAENRTVAFQRVCNRCASSF